VDETPRSYLLTEAAQLTGLSAEALRKRIRRGSLRGHRSNEDGLWRVWLTSTDVEATKAAAASGRTEDKPLEGEVAALREALAREREGAERLRAERDAALALSARRAEELMQARERAAHAEGVAEARQERIAAAEAELEGFRRMPWWRRALFKP